MHPPIPSSTETSLGASYIREDLLQREARNNHVARLVRTIARIVFVLLVVDMAWAIAFGPGAAIGWIVTYLIPVAVITGAIIASLALLLWASKRLPESPRVAPTRLAPIGCNANGAPHTKNVEEPERAVRCAGLKPVNVMLIPHPAREPRR